MKRSLFLIIMAVIPAFFGLMFFISPEGMLGKYGFTVDAGMKIMGYSVGSMLIALGALNFLSRSSPSHRLLAQYCGRTSSSKRSPVQLICTELSLAR